jgi:hypothetical protein
MRNLEIEKFKPKPDRDALIEAYWIMFLRTPARPKPEPDGFFTLGEIGEAKEKDWERLTPYSLAKAR